MQAEVLFGTQACTADRSQDDLINEYPYFLISFRVEGAKLA